MKTRKKPMTLCTVWNGQLVIPGNKRSTRKMARDMIGWEVGKLVGHEELWSDARLKVLPEYDG